MESVTSPAGASLPLLPAWQRTRDKPQSGRIANGSAVLHRSLSHVHLPLSQASARHGPSHIEKLASKLHHHESAAGRSQMSGRLGYQQHFPSLPTAEHDGDPKSQVSADHPSIGHSQSQTNKSAAIQSSKMGADTWFIKQQQYEALIEDLQAALKAKEEELAQVRKQLDKAKSVLSVITPLRSPSGTALNTMQNDELVEKMVDHNHIRLDVPDRGASAEQPKKKQGISGESSTNNHNQQLQELHISKIDKDFKSKHVIKDALGDNDFLTNLDSSQTREIIEYMYPLEVGADSFILRQGDEGHHLYVLADGRAEVLKDDGSSLGRLTSGKAFGELAILYNCTRTASVKALTNCKLWVLDRNVFQVVMMRSGLQRQEEIVSFLRSVPDLKNLAEEKLAKIGDALEVEYYSAGSYILHEGETGDTFFLLYEGQVKVVQKLPGKGEPQMVRLLEKGCYFGEKALLQEERRTASIVAVTDAECLTLDRNSFIQLIGDLRELKERDYGDEQRKASCKEESSRHHSGTYGHRSANRSSSSGRKRHPRPVHTAIKTEFAHLQLSDLEVRATLGQGGFGRVVLVQLRSDANQTFALKCMKKAHIVKQRQQEHVLSEKNITLRLACPFICRMYCTFKDRKYLYMMMEACLGGELWTILRDRNYFEDEVVKFYAACAVLALEYLHERCVIYRDLKPENVLLDNRGYAKIADFGFAKDIETKRKTWTFCGTPQYIAPEAILNKGHDHAVDYWALGIYMFELSTGNPPFDYNGDQLQVYNSILRGLAVVDFPRRIGKNSVSLMKRLCKTNPVERLGYQRNGVADIKRHKFFQGFDWNSLTQQTMTPPIKPNVSGPHDVSNFDHDFPPDTEIPPDEVTGWDAHF